MGRLLQAACASTYDLPVARSTYSDTSRPARFHLTITAYLPHRRFISFSSPLQVLRFVGTVCQTSNVQPNRSDAPPPNTIRRCFDLVYAVRLLVDGYGFSTRSTSIEFVGDVQGTEVEWTLGALLHFLLTDQVSFRL